MKNWYKSKTIVIAILTGVLGIVVAFETQYPEVGIFAIVKSVVDIALRFITSEAVK